MLEIKNLVKIYKPKKGVPVRALDGVSLKMPETGMVFLLGKSGSGKSTLLNLLGGLDKYDGGEIIIKGVSSKDFSQQHFDSYRNTYVGFIFQEYNILEEFTVGANIALALELQGKKASDEEINRILHEVDLDGYGNRRPNELSGGQKQRVAIARALVKNPKIIMADEPTGALDSVTGKQVLGTLKRLSESKLVIVVSHDREFATHYGDRIVELADGKVISDTIPDTSEDARDVTITFEGATAKIPMGYHLTEDDRKAINDYIDRLSSGAELEFATKKARKFINTDNESIEHTDKSPFALIKSKLSLKHAFKIGGSGLKHKKFRLVMTCLLSCIAFTLFGLVDTFSAYNHQKVLTNSLYDSQIQYATVKKEVLQGEGDYTYWSSFGTKLTLEEIEELSQSTGIEFNAVYTGGEYYGLFFSNLGEKDSGNYSMKDNYQGRFSGVVEITQSTLDSHGYKLIAGRLPDKDTEIAISAYMCQQFKERGYINHISGTEFDKSGRPKSITINKEADMVGKKIHIGAAEFEIVGIVETNFDTDGRYADLFKENEQGGNEIFDFVLLNEFESALFDDYTGMIMGSKGIVESYIKSIGNPKTIKDADMHFYSDFGDLYIYSATKLSDINTDSIIWIDGKKESLGEKELIITRSIARGWLNLETFDENGVPHLDIDRLKKAEFKLDLHIYSEFEPISEDGYKIVGIIDNENEESKVNYSFEVVLPDKMIDSYFSGADGDYDMALGAMPEDKGGISTLAHYCYTDYDGTRYVLRNPVSFELDSLNEAFEMLATVFLWIGVGFALFAAILLSNFIATSIAYKKQEIGILRAIGSRGNDVFRIFFSEAFIIAMINFLLACAGTGIATFAINSAVRENVGLLITVLTFDIRQIALLFVISVAIAAAASFLPVKKVASKRPIDAIRNR